MEEKADSIYTINEAVYRFVFDGATIEQLDKLGYPNSAIVYIITAIVFGAIFIFLDLGIVKSGIREKSLLGVIYREWYLVILLIIVWSFGAGVMSFVGKLLKVFDDTIQSSVVSGFGWIYVLNKLVEKIREPEVNQEEDESITSELNKN